MPVRTLPAAPRVPVDVTEYLIEDSTARDSGHCMIADAVKEAVPDATYISADIQTIRFTRGGFRYTYLTPRKAQVALIQFDQGEKPEPFAFQLRTGQTTRSGSRAAVKTGKPQERTEAQQKASEDAMEHSTKGFHTEKKTRAANKGDTAKLVQHPGGQSAVPDIRGGRVPPVAPLAGGSGVGNTVPKSRRRVFGLRAMDRMR